MAWLVLALIVLGGCGDPLSAGATPTAPPEPSGVRGDVLLGPTCPVVDGDAMPCHEPYAAELVVLDVDQQEVARVSSGPDGRFEIVLPPGDYTIVPQPGDPLPTATPLSVTVVAGQFVELQVNYDSGIR